MSGERYYGDIREVLQTRDVTLVNEKLTDPSWELLAVRDVSFTDAGTKTTESYIAYVLGRRAQGPAQVQAAPSPQTPASAVTTSRPPSASQSIQDVLDKAEWRPSKNPKYYWTFVDKLPKDVIEAIAAAGPSGLKLGGHTYKICGDNLNLVGRWG